MGDGITVKGPEGTIKFPAGMKPADIEAAMAAHYPAKGPAGGASSSWDTQDRIGVNRPTEWQQLRSAIPALGHAQDIVIGRKPAMASMALEDTTQLAYPERVYSLNEQEQHPIRTGIDHVLGGLTSPENLMLMQGMGGPLPKVLGRGASAIFGVQMAKGTKDTTEQAVKAYNRGDISEAKRLGTEAAVSGIMATGAIAHAGGPELGTKAGELWRDESGSMKVPGTGGSRPATAQEAIFRRGVELKSQGLSEPETLFHLMKEFPEQSDEIAKAYGYQPGQRTKMGGLASATEGPKPQAPSLQTAGSESRSGESLRSSAGPSVKQQASEVEIKFLQEKLANASPDDRLEVLKQLRNAEDRAAGINATAPQDVPDISKMGRKAKMDEEDRLARTVPQPARDTTTLQQIQAEHPEWTLSQQLQEAAKRVNPPSAEKGVQTPGALNTILDARTQEIMRRKPGMAEGTARAMAKDAMERERGSLSLKPLTPQIGPQQASPTWQAGNALGNIASAFGRAFGDLDAVKDTERKARMITRGIDSEKKLLALQLEEKFKNSIESHDNDGKTEFRAFMDAGEGKPGAQFLKPEDQLLANQLHSEFQKRWSKVNNLLDRDLGHGIEDYLSHIWKRPGQARDKLEFFINAKRPMAGRAGFLKERVYQYASEGLDRGLEPLSMNPVRMQLASLHQLDKFITAHELKDAYKEADLAQWHTNSESIPLGWDKLHDKLFEPKKFEEGKLIQYGSYYAPPEVARIFNRYLQPGLSGRLGYDALRNYGNLLNQVNLGVSGYHGSFITIVAGGSDVALGLEKAFNNRDIGGVNNMLRGTIGTFSAPLEVAIQGIADWLGPSTSFWDKPLTSTFTKLKEQATGYGSASRFYARGREIQKEAITPSVGPKTREQATLASFVEELTKAGASFKQDQFYRTPEGQKFFRGLIQTPLKLLEAMGASVRDDPSLRSRIADVGKTGYATIQAGVQRFPITRGIMDYYVPRVKLGMASYMMEAKLQELVKNGIYDQDTIRTEFSKIWDSVDDRAGQMKYDNLFWDKTAKDVSFLSIRAVGWDMGTTRAIGGAGVDVLSGASKVLKGEKPSTVLTGRAAFVLGTTITLGTIGAVMTYLATGKKPQSTLDYFYPPTGRTGTNGKPERYALPTYAKDAVNLYNRPGKTLVSKFHPSVEQLFEFYNNRDFQDTEIYDRGGTDPLYKKGYDIMRWWGKTATPFAVTTTLARIRGGEGQGPGASATGIALESFGGLQRASRDISSSKAEDFIFDRAKRHWEAGPISRDDRARRELFFKFRTQERLGTLDISALDNALDTGKLQPNDYNRIFKDKGLTDAQSEFKLLDLPTAIEAMQLMKPEERTQYADQMQSTLHRDLRKYTPDEQDHYLDVTDKLLEAVPQ